MEENEVQIIGESDSETITSILQTLSEVHDNIDHPILTTDFEDYTVTEGLLLVLVLSVVAIWMIRMIKGGLNWLLW